MKFSKTAKEKVLQIHHKHFKELLVSCLTINDMKSFKQVKFPNKKLIFFFDKDVKLVSQSRAIRVLKVKLNEPLNTFPINAFYMKLNGMLGATPSNSGGGLCFVSSFPF